MLQPRLGRMRYCFTRLRLRPSQTFIKMTSRSVYFMKSSQRFQLSFRHMRTNMPPGNAPHANR